MVEEVEEVRKLAKIVVIDDVLPHKNADRLDLAIIGGWQCIVKKGEFKKGDIGLYCEIDSLLPVSVPEFEFLLERTHDLKSVNEVTYGRIRTIKMRKEISQGLLITIPKMVKDAKAGDDVTAVLGVKKYIKPAKGAVQEEVILIPTWLDKFTAKLKDSIVDHLLKDWPNFVSKTEQERVQNMSLQYSRAVAAGETFERTQKLNGESMTVYFKRNQAKDTSKSGVCSRNYEISTVDIVWTFKESMKYWFARFLQGNRRMLRTRYFHWPRWKNGVKASDDPFVSHWLRLDIANRLKTYYDRTGIELALQGELTGPGHQNNKDGLEVADFYVYNVFVIDANGTTATVPGYLMPADARTTVEALGLKYVPVVDAYAKLPETIKECLKAADGKSIFSDTHSREGDVYKSNVHPYSFKVISNNYLLEDEEE